MAYDKNASINIWVGNIGWYNEGYNTGDWFALPMDREELWKEINKACKVDRFHEELWLQDWEVPYGNVSEYESIDDLNALAAVIDSASEWQLEAAEAYIDYNGQYSAIECANIIMDADNISFIGYSFDVGSNEENYGYTLADMDGTLQYLRERGLEDYFDFERYGSDDSDVYLTDEGYLCLSGDDPSTNDYTALEILAEEGYYTEPDEDEGEEE